jgi:hypothetical protein
MTTPLGVRQRFAIFPTADFIKSFFNADQR